MQRLHASCVAFGNAGVLLLGGSGAGKSDLALRAIDAGAMLVADDQVELRRVGAELIASVPKALAGLIEVRGVGIVRLPFRAEAKLRLAVELLPPERISRLPEHAQREYLGVALPLSRLAPFEVSAVVKLRLAVRLATGHIMPAP